MLARQLSAEGHDITLVDNDPDALESTIERYDVMSVQGNCASMEVLRNAGVDSADLLITATGQDEINLLCCLTAHGMNPHLHTIARIRTPDYAESTYAMRKMFALSLTVNPERQTAREIDRLLRYPGFLKREKFANGLVEIVEIRVDEKSPLRDQPLYKLSEIAHCQVLVCAALRNKLSEIAHCQVLVCAALRNGKAVTPDGDFVICEGDRLFVTASARNLTILLHSIGYMTKKIEIDRERCEHLAEMLPDATVIQGDASIQSVLEREKLSQADAVISMTGLDELNVLTSLYAHERKVPQVITKVGRGENLGVISKLAVGSIVSPKELCTNTIVTYVRAMENQVGAAVTVHSIADGQAEAIEFVVDANTKYLNTPLRQIHLKRNIRLASITSGRNIEFPNGDSRFHAGDRIVIVSSGGETIQQLNDIFA